MADTETYIRRMGAARRIGRGLLALTFAAAGAGLLLVVLAIAALNIRAVRQAVLDFSLQNIQSGEMQIEIGEIGGTWPQHLVLEGLRISDNEGDWLTLTRLELDWRPLALWRGEVLVDRLATDGLSLLRLPSGEEAQDDESAGFDIAALPVGINLARFTLTGTGLGGAVAGEQVTFDATGGAALSGSRTALTLDAARTDGISGSIRLAANYLSASQRGSLTLKIEDGAAGQRGLAARLLDLDGLENVSLSAEGEMRDGLMVGSATVDGGNAVQAELNAHGALARGTSLNLKLTASGNIVARELEFSGTNAALGLEARLTAQRRGAYTLTVNALEAGMLFLAGEARAAPKMRGGWSVTGNGRLAGLNRLLGIDSDILGDIGWKVALDADSEVNTLGISDAIVTTGAGTVRASGKAVTRGGFSFSGTGGAEISDLAPVGAILGQPMQGEASLGFGDISYADGAGSANLTIETGTILTGTSELDAMLAEGLNGNARVEFGAGSVVAVEGVALQAGSRLNLNGDFTLARSGEMQGNANLRLAEAGAILGDTMQGALSASGRIDGTIDLPTLSLDAELAGGSVAGFDARNASLSIKMERGRGPVSVRLSGADGVASLRMDTVMPGNGSMQLENINADLFGAALGGALTVSPDGMATGQLAGDRVMLAPLGKISGLAMDGRADIEATFDAAGGTQNAAISFASRRVDIDVVEPASLDIVTIDIALNDIGGNGSVDARIDAEGGTTGNTRFTQIEATADGPLDRISISALIAGERLSIKTEPVYLEIQAEVAPALVTIEKLDAAIGDAKAELASPLRLETGDTMRLRGLDIRFEGPAGPGTLSGDFTSGTRSARADLALENLPLELVSPFMPFEVLGGTVAGQASIDTGPEAGSVKLRFDGVTLAEGGLDIRPAFDATLDAIWARRRLQLQAEAHGISETPFRLKASVPLVRNPKGAFPVLPERGPLEAQLAWSGPMATLMALADLPGQRLTGDAEIALSADGDISAPRISGHARISNGVFENFETGTALRDLSLSVEGQRSEVLTFSLNARDSGDGRLTADGTLSLAADAARAADIRARFDNMRMVSRRDLVLAVEGELSLTGTALPPSLDERMRLEGSLTTTDARSVIPHQLPPGVSTIDVIIVQGPDQADTVEEPEEARPLPLELDVTLAIGNPPARVAGRGVDSLWTGAVRATGLAEDPAVEGVLTSQRGTLDFAGKTFALSRGRVIFAGERPINPRLDIELDYVRTDFSATVGLAGRGSSPEIALSSSPSLPRDEIISRILFDKGVGELTAFEAAQLASTAAELSGRGLGGFGVLNQIQETLGLDVLRVDQGSSGGTTVSAGKYLREDIYVGVEQGALASDSNVKIEIDVTQNISVETKIGNDASSDVGVNWKWDY